MMHTTLKLLKAGLESDPSLTPSERTRLLAAIRSGCHPPKAEPSPAAPRLIRRAEAARRLGYGLRMIDRLAQEGVLIKRKLPHRKRASGFLESDLIALLTQAV